MSLYLYDIIDIIIEKKKLITKTISLLVFINNKISGIVPITEERNIFLNFVILFNKIPVVIKMI